MSVAPNFSSSGRVLAAIDSSSFARSVCDYAAWAALRLGAPVELVHVLDRHPETAPTLDLSGSLGAEDREALLEELASIDERRSKLAQARGRLLLQDATQQVVEAGVPGVDARMRNGAFVESMIDLQADDIHMFVLGKRGKHAEASKGHLGGNLERVVRALHRPLLIVPSAATKIERFAIAFDGGATTSQGVEMLAASPLLKGLPCHLVMAAVKHPEQHGRLDWAKTRLESAGFAVKAAILPGDADTAIGNYMQSESIDLLVMGAYGHSRIRHLIVGSTTTALLRTSATPVLLLR